MAKKNLIKSIQKRVTSFLGRRPHRSFRRTRRRDYVRSLELPGYFKFNKYVFKVLWDNRRTFIILALFYAIIAVLILNIASQDNYNSLRSVLEGDKSGTFNGFLGKIGSAGLLFVAGISGGMSGTLSEGQQIYAVIVLVFTWLTSVWLLRNIMAGHKVKIRDGLYNAGSPILPTIIVALLFIVQLLPIALAAIAYVAAVSSGLLSGGIEAMLFWIFAGLMTVLSLYWMIGTLFALVIITIPGMYPYRAIKMAGDLVVGRRVRILLRLIWMIVSALFVWAVIMIPMIMIDSWLKGIWSIFASIPTVPVLFLILSALTVVWVSSYIYLFYRKVIDDDAKPA